jgi:hypothetical protein
LRCFLDQQAADAAAPEIGFDEQAIELRIAIRARQDDGEPGRSTPVLGDDDEARSDLLGRQFDRIRIGDEVGAVFVPPERCATLQVLQRFAL